MFAANADTTSPHDLVAASRRLRHAVHHGSDASDLFDSLAALDGNVLATLRDDERAATAFWLNVHGALVERARSTTTTHEWCRVASVRLDAETVTHDILRAGRWKYGFGYLPNPFMNGFERRHRLRTIDPRIHFAVYATRHAPGLSVTYTASNVDDELAVVTGEYLDATVEYDSSRDVALLPREFLWYRGDFGGRSGIRSLLVEHDALPPDASPRFSYVPREPSFDAAATRESPPEDPL